MNRRVCALVLVCGSACGANMRAQETSTVTADMPVCTPTAQCELAGTGSGERIAYGIVGLSVLVGGALLLQTIRR